MKTKFLWRFKMKTTFTPNLIKELKAFYVERLVDNMDVKDLVTYVTDDMDNYVEGQTDEEFLIEAQNYWDDGFDDIIEEIREYADCDFKKPIEERRNAI